METTWRVRPEDRDEQGKIKVEAPQEPRSLADLLPRPAEIKQDAQRPPHKFTRAEAASIAVVALLAAFVFVWTARTPSEPVSAPLPNVGAVPSTLPHPSVVSLPTSAPVPTAQPIAAYWAPGGEHAPDLSHGTIQPIARYGETWVQVQDGRWIAAGDAGLTDNALVQLPDRAPPTPAPRVIVVQAPPPPDPCLTAGTANQTVTVCGQGDLNQQARDKWIATYGGNAGELGSPSPQPMR